MSGSTARLQAINAVKRYEPPAGFFPTAEAPGEIFGENVFTKTKMQARLPKPVFKSLMATIEHSKTLDPTVADVVAAAMRDWAMEKGATHYAHVFYPLTGLTAEKHDSFLEPAGDGSSIAEFSGKTLTQGEPDASSFPNGGLRATFEARGYTGWDATSPAYILENPNGNTLCIPTVFVSMTGEALDHKTPLLRSQQAMAKQAERVLKLFGHENPDAVVSFAGAEQEYFLIDRSFFLSRPDLLNTGRTLFGAKPPKGQEFDDHYFGAIPERVLAFMLDAERELFKLGIPAKTRHNEVAPGQFELAPMFERSNVAADHQQLLMVTLKRVAQKHGMECLFHEKPFEGINGSGKHVNFSLGNSTEGNLLLPGDTPHDNAQFLVFCAAVIRAVHKYGGLLRASVASATNDHRLGANEAPRPSSRSSSATSSPTCSTRSPRAAPPAPRRRVRSRSASTPSPCCRPIPATATGPVPFAFTGNRFEFRAPGSLQSIAGPMVTINTILADSLDYLATELESLVAEGADFNTAVEKVLEDVITAHGAVVFNGDGYTEDWKIEAESRGLPNLHTTLDAVPELIKPDAMELFSRYGVFTEREMHSRYDIALEHYILSIGVEARITLEIANTVILPAALRYQTELATNVSSLKAAGIEADPSTLNEVTTAISALRAGIAELPRATEPRPLRFRPRGSGARRDRLPAGHGDRTVSCRRPRDAGGRRPLAARHLPRDALHALRRAEGARHPAVTRTRRR